MKGRISELFWLDVYIYDCEFGVDPRAILDELKILEGLESSTQTKAAAMFRREPLKGLWHKHFFSAHFVPQNISNGLAGDKLTDLVEEVMNPEKSSIITQGMIDELAHRVTHEPLETRAKANKLTGEWIIFAKHDNSNYYLCLSTHEAGDDSIYKRIIEHCIRDFPFLPLLTTVNNT